MPQCGIGTILSVWQPGGVFSALNITAPTTLNAPARTIMTVSVVNPGTAGSLTINDCTSTGSASSANQIVTAPFGNLTTGQCLKLRFPVQNGITVSSVPTGGVFAIAYS